MYQGSTHGEAKETVACFSKKARLCVHNTVSCKKVSQAKNKAELSNSTISFEDDSAVMQAYESDVSQRNRKKSIAW